MCIIRISEKGLRLRITKNSLHLGYFKISKSIDEQRNKDCRGFPGGTVVKKLPANTGDTVSSPGPGRSHMPRSN